MRERLARRFALLTAVAILLLSAAFAAIQNPPKAAQTTASTSTSAPSVAASANLTHGRAVVDAQGCLRCHSIAGVGSPRSPLDGVGARLDRAGLRDWVTASDTVRDELSPRAIEAKMAYRSLPEADLDALLDYLASLND